MILINTKISEVYMNKNSALENSNTPDTPIKDGEAFVQDPKHNNEARKEGMGPNTQRKR